MKLFNLEGQEEGSERIERRGLRRTPSVDACLLPAKGFAVVFLLVVGGILPWCVCRVESAAKGKNTRFFYTQSLQIAKFEQLLYRNVCIWRK